MPTYELLKKDALVPIITALQTAVAGSAGTATTKAADAAASAGTATTKAADAAASAVTANQRAVDAAASAATATTQAGTATTQASNASNSAVTATQQAVIAVANRFLWRGPWAPFTFYAAGDGVRQDGSSYRRPVAGTSGATFDIAQWELMAQRGLNGWEAATANVVDGNRIVQQIVSWFGGEGPPPASGQFVGPTGFVATAAAATDIRGAQGLPGTLTASAFPVVPPAARINPNAAKIVSQDGATLQKSDFPSVTNVVSGYYANVDDFGQNGNIMGMLMHRFADTWQGRTLASCESWNGSAYIASTAPITAAARTLLRGRTTPNSTSLAPGERIRLTVSHATSTSSTILAITTPYSTPTVDATIMLEASSDGVVWNTVIPTSACNAFMGFSYYVSPQINAGFTRLTIVANADADATKRFVVAGISLFTGNLFNGTPPRNGVPLMWDENNSVRIGLLNGTPPDPSSVLDLFSTTRGFLLPRMSQAQRIAIPNPAEGLLVHQLDGTAGIWIFQSGAWEPIVGKTRTYTPTSSTDPNLLIGHVCHDNAFQYRKGTDGTIRRIAYTAMP